MTTYHEPQVHWPAERQVCKDRKNGPFRTNMTDACDRIERELSAFTRSGHPLRTQELWIFADADIGQRCRFLANQRGARDPRVSVRFDLDGATYQICADRYYEPWQNLCGIAEYIKSIRAQERNGIFTAQEMMAAFAALPARTPWYEVLGVGRDASRSQIESAYRALAKQMHPDVEGGSHEAMSALNAAYEDAKEST